MSPADLAPVDSEFISILVCRVCLGNERYSLAKVKVDFVLGIDTLDFDETDTVVLGTETTLVAKDGTIYMKTRSSGGHYKCVYLSCNNCWG